MVDASYKPYGLEPIETASRDEIAALQTQRLALVAEARLRQCRGAIERSSMPPAWHPSDFRRLEDLAKFPFTTKADLRDNYPFGMFAVPQDRIVRIHASSGTTGKPTVVGYTQKDIDNWARSDGALDPRLRRPPGHEGACRLWLWPVHRRARRTLRRREARLHGDPDFGRHDRTAGAADRRFQTRHHHGDAELHARDPRRIPRAQGLDPRDCSLSIGIFGAEPWTNQMRGEIEEAFAMDAVDIYGLSEVMGPGVANECVETKDGLHIWEDHFLPEVIDPQTGKPLPDGEKGELVFTSLTKEGLPIIRYRTRDLTRLLPGTARSHRRMEKVTGRSDDMMIVRGVNVFPTQIEELLLRCQGLSPHYLIELTREDRLDVATLLVEARPETQGTAERNAEAASLAAHIRNNIGIGMKVLVQDPGAIERSAGKARRVVDKRPKS